MAEDVRVAKATVTTPVGYSIIERSNDEFDLTTQVADDGHCTQVKIFLPPRTDYESLRASLSEVIGVMTVEFTQKPEPDAKRSIPIEGAKVAAKGAVNDDDDFWGPKLRHRAYETDYFVRSMTREVTFPQEDK